MKILIISQTKQSETLCRQNREIVAHSKRDMKKRMKIDRGMDKSTKRWNERQTDIQMEVGREMRKIDKQTKRWKGGEKK